MNPKNYNTYQPGNQPNGYPNQPNSYPNSYQQSPQNTQPGGATNPTIDQIVRGGYQMPVQNPQNQQKPKKEPTFNYKKIAKIVGIVVLIVICLSLGLVLLVNAITRHSSEEVADTPSSTTEPLNPERTVPTKINFQLTVDNWVNTQTDPGNSGIIIYDLDNNEVVARHNEEKVFPMESVYKMFVAYEGYHRMSQEEGWGDALYNNLGKDYTGQTFSRALCLDRMIRYSYSPCAEAMWNEFGHNNLQNIFLDRGFEMTNISGITSTPYDIMKLYQLYYEHKEFSDESWETIRDSMLNQDSNHYGDLCGGSCNWRRGLPSGFVLAKVYNKVGWRWGENGWYSFIDAAFVEFPEAKNKSSGETVPERHYIVVVMTKYTDHTEIADLGREIEKKVENFDNY